ncbi:hypothetical protein LOAG_13606, partial [Loa loa]
SEIITGISSTGIAITPSSSSQQSYDVKFTITKPQLHHRQHHQQQQQPPYPLYTQTHYQPSTECFLPLQLFMICPSYIPVLCVATVQAKKNKKLLSIFFFSQSTYKSFMILNKQAPISFEGVVKILSYRNDNLLEHTCKNFHPTSSNTNSTLIRYCRKNFAFVLEEIDDEAPFCGLMQDVYNVLPMDSLLEYHRMIRRLGK